MEVRTPIHTATLRGAALLLALALPAVHASGTVSGTGPLQARAKLDFKIVIPVVARLSNIQQPTHVTVEPRHVAQGYVDLDHATSVRLTTNAPRGAFLKVAFASGWIKRTTVRLDGHEFDAGAQQQALPGTQRPVREMPLSIGYRIYLSDAVRPGTYAWPLSVQLISVTA